MPGRLHLSWRCQNIVTNDKNKLNIATPVVTLVFLQHALYFYQDIDQCPMTNKWNLKLFPYSPSMVELKVSNKYIWMLAPGRFFIMNILITRVLDDCYRKQTSIYIEFPLQVYLCNHNVMEPAFPYCTWISFMLLDTMHTMHTSILEVLCISLHQIHGNAERPGAGDAIVCCSFLFVCSGC